jgi:hypothetical protein
MGALSTSANTWLEPRRIPGYSKELSLMDHLFNRLDGYYPNRWRAAFADDNAIQNWREAWADAFAEEGLTPDEIRVGIAQCRRMFDWPPSFPEFIKACRPAMDYERAFIEAVEQQRLRQTGKDKWSSPAIYWASTTLGNDIQSHMYSAISKRWAAAVDMAREKIKRGDLPNEVPQRMDALPAPGKTTISKEQADVNIARMKAMLEKPGKPFFAVAVEDVIAAQEARDGDA